MNRLLWFISTVHYITAKLFLQVIFEFLAKNRHFEQKTDFFDKEFADYGDKTFIAVPEKEKVFTHGRTLLLSNQVI